MRTGDREELQRFFATHYKRLFGLALMLTGRNHHDAEELVGLTAEKLAKSWHKRKGEDEYAFASAVLRNAWVDTVRKKGARPRETVLDGRPEPGDGADHTATVAARVHLQKALRSLSHEELQVFSLRLFGADQPADVMTYDEIGKRLHMSATKTRQVWDRVVKKLDAS